MDRVTERLRQLVRSLADCGNLAVDRFLGCKEAASP
jgi:hypothetical protein